MTCVTISHAIEALPIVDAAAPIFDQGEIAENPRPVPNASKISERAAATNPPLITAVQEIPAE
jgi:hypothetical protein